MFKHKYEKSSIKFKDIILRYIFMIDMKNISSGTNELTHWGRVTHICVSKLTIIGSDNGLSPGRRQAIIWTYVGILLIRPLGKNFNEIIIEIHTFSFKKIHFKMSSGKWRPFCLGLNVLMNDGPCSSCKWHQIFWDRRWVSWSNKILWLITRSLLLTMHPCC